MSPQSPRPPARGSADLHRLDRPLLLIATGLVLTLVVLAFVGSRLSSDSASATGPQSPSGDASSAASSSEEPGPGPGPDVPHFTIAPLAPGEKPPQFILFSFDGAGSPQKWKTFRAVADKADARFTGFLSGVYLLPDAAKSAYAGPGHSPGKSSIGFGGTPDEVAASVDTLNDAYSDGYEIGTHYNGHFCDGADPSGNNWSTDQWQDEINQFHGFLQNYQTIGNVPGSALEVTPADIKDTYRSMYEAARGGNRAPLVIGNHFNNWSGNAFNPAVEQFMAEACDDPGTVCTTYQNVLAWMAAQDPAVLDALVALPPTYNE